MSQNIENIDDLIGKYLAGEATEQEISAVEKWKAASASNHEYFGQFETIFEKAASVKTWQHFDTDAAWNKVRSNLKNRGGKTVAFPPPSSRSTFVWRVAASITIALGVGFLLYKMNSSSEISKPIEVISQGQAVEDTLPNGSDVFLNKETKIAYQYKKNEKKHEVKLQGEAYFNVKHNPDETFVIDAAGIYIKDIGTSFNVKAYPESNTVEVTVEEGEVVFYTDDNPGIHLHAGGKGVYDKKKKTFTIEQPEANVLAYKTRFFIFSGTDLKTVVTTINQVYEEKIIIDERLNHCQLTVSFKEESIDEIAQVIAETLGLTKKESGGNIILEGKGCE